MTFPNTGPRQVALACGEQFGVVRGEERGGGGLFKRHKNSQGLSNGVLDDLRHATSIPRSLSLRAAGSFGNLLRTQIGHAEHEQELLLATNSVRVRLRCGRDSLAVRHGKLFEMGLSLCLPSRFAPRVELVASAGVVGGLAGSAMRLVSAPRRSASRLSGSQPFRDGA